jgi:hypothetical protein
MLSHFIQLLVRVKIRNFICTRCTLICAVNMWSLMFIFLLIFSLPRKTDMERKIEIYNFSARTRQLFVRLLALVKWANNASKVDKSAVSIVQNDIVCTFKFAMFLRVLVLIWLVHRTFYKAIYSCCWHVSLHHHHIPSQI